ncbi:C39 family peptidase [Flintibacter muris]|uniref:C39 family peptidase n=1 Tax=Flintibacter muris TaxID=2941327 RepID=UPI00203E0B8F|nr:C39 family peptidase [Flintibacter muris]
MNKRPVSYLQTDKRWKALPYQVKGESATIGGSGCGPTAAAMAIETLTGQTFTPVDACKWSVDHGYKALNQGTYYSYFVPQFKAFGIDCKQLLGSSLHNKPDHPVHDQVKGYLEEGYYAVALMGPGTWTSGGHYILLWAWDDKVRINDPASTKDKRLNGDPETFKREVKQYWLIDAREYNKGDDDVDQEKFNQMFATAMQQYRQTLRDNDCGDWSEAARKFVVERGIFAGGDPGPDGQPNYMWEDLLTREQAAQLLYAFAIKCGLV